MEILQTPAGRIVGGVTMPALCLDLDGTVRYSKSGEFIQSPDDIALFADAEAKIWEYRDKGYLILGISNQGGVAYGYKTPQQVDYELDVMCDLFERNPFHFLKQCFHHPQGTVAPFNIRSLLRKPDIGMLALMETELFNMGYIVDWDNSLFVGDRKEDLECAANAGIAFQYACDFFNRWD
jgi:D-glycero-D-manno-heptose 1,7-bisphosphate phosphatase